MENVGLKKICKTCDKEKNLLDFHKSKSHHDGHKTQCKDCVKKYHKEYVIKNKKRLKSRYLECYLKNAEKRKTYSKLYGRQNRDKITAKSAKRRASKLRATPSWLTKEQEQEIKNFYWLRQDLWLITGEEYHVDHIVPLQGKNVCGLHVPWNLQILHSKENIKKGNGFGKK